MTAPVQVNIDFSALANLIVNAIIAGLQTLFAPLPLQFEEWVYHGLQSLLSADGAFNLLTHIPTEWTVDFQPVTDLWRETLKVQIPLAALVIVIQGYRVMHGTIDIWYALTRTGFFMIIGLSMILWAHLIINVVNAASSGIGSAPIDIRSKNLPQEIIQALTLIIGIALTILAMVKGAIGVVFIDVLIVTAPFILPISALPIFEGLGEWWAEEATTWLLRPVMVAIVLRLGLGIASFNLGGFEFLFVIAAFWLAWTMDSRIRRFSVGAWGSVGQLNMLHRGASALAGAVGGASAPAAVAAAT